MQPSQTQDKYIILEANVGNDMKYLLGVASEINIEGSWYPVLGYDVIEDVMCLDGQGAVDDMIIEGASDYLNHTEVMISMKVFKN